MPVTAETSAPYAPASAVLEIVNRHRSKGLPPVVDGMVLQRSGISDSLIPRTMQALQTLDLIDADGKPTSILEGIRLAPQAEFQTRLAEWLNAAYADALVFIDPATATEAEIRDAFRQYKPIGQQGRMVTLFTGLFAAAGVGPERPRAPAQSRSTKAPSRKPQPAAATVAAKKRQHQAGGSNSAFGGASLPVPISALLTKLPPDGRGWTQSARDKFLVAFEAMLDFSYPVVTDGGQEQDDAAEEADP